MYTKPTLTVVSLAVENNSCNCWGSVTLPVGNSLQNKLNPAAATCGGAFMAPTYYTA